MTPPTITDATGQSGSLPAYDAGGSLRSLPAYEAWLRRRGAGDGTIRQYLFVAGRSEDPFDKLTDRKLSPKYRRFLKAAALSHAKFLKDGKLITELSELRLPAPVRKTVKVPLSESAWRTLRTAIDESDEIEEPVRAVLGIMATRGLRSGDVLRLQRREVDQALKTSTLSFVAKGGRRLEFGVTSAWKKYLEILRESFAGTKAGRVSDLVSPRAEVESRPRSAGAQIARALRRVGLAVGKRKLELDSIDELHPHQLRRSYSVMFYAACGRDPMALKQHMQWNSIETAMAYVDHDRRDELDEVARKMF